MSDSKFPGMSLHVTIFVAPEEVPKFLAFLRTAYEAVIKEPECTFFEVYTNPSVPGQVSWVEGWNKDFKWLMEVMDRLPGWAAAKPEHFEGKYEG
ncbi:hypothetical protein LSUE1_G003854 [Lachnellula suecica]|uniref:ABM domain-containing protein n=1 Tax=Lachnellula suecica TaxID=602035 RepID=A0A8T9CJ33_9HELO|nr:hypothetical protein LSUE1_G003854 [Lachnellula suecica]